MEKIGKRKKARGFSVFVWLEEKEEYEEEEEEMEE